MPWTRYEVETRWLENGRMLAWGYVGEFAKKETAVACRDRLLEIPRKVKQFDCRVVEIVRDNDGRILRQTVLPNETQLEIDFESEKKFVSGLPARAA